MMNQCQINVQEMTDSITTALLAVFDPISVIQVITYLVFLIIGAVIGSYIQNQKNMLDVYEHELIRRCDK